MKARIDKAEKRMAISGTTTVADILKMLARGASAEELARAEAELPRETRDVLARFAAEDARSDDDGGDDVDWGEDD